METIMDKVKKHVKGHSFPDIVRFVTDHYLHLVVYDIMDLDQQTQPVLSGSPVKIRPMELADIEQLDTAYFVTHEDLKEALEQPDRLSRAYTFFNENDKIIGYCWVLLKGSDAEFKIRKADAYIHQFAINDADRGHHCSSRALQEVCRQLQREGHPCVTLAVRNYNNKAIRCYKTAGFRKSRKCLVHIGKGYRVFPCYTL